MLLISGWSDPIFAPEDLIRWYGLLDHDTRASTGAGADNFARLFLAPGMTHCGGGPSLDDADTLTALTDWVEKKRAPSFLVARGNAFPGQSRPLCPYPQFAVYQGPGEGADARDYVCKAPKA